MPFRSVTAFVFACLLGSGCAGTQVAPEPVDPQLVLMEGALGNQFVIAGSPSEALSHIRIETRGIANQARPPINLALVIDTSGSMEGTPIEDARNASLELLSILHPEDRLSVVAFHSRTEVLLPSTRLEGADLDELREDIGAMEARGTTDLAGGLQRGLEELVQNLEPRGINRLVLLSDGVPNDAAPIVPLAQAAGERGIRITALGLGLEYDETLLGQVAQRSGGQFHFVEESSEVASVFTGEVLRFERLVARNLVLNVQPGPGVTIDGVVGQSVAPGANGTVVVSLGDVSEGEHRDVIVRMHADARRSGAMVEMIDAVLTFDDAATEAGRFERRLFLGARATSDEAELEAGRNEAVERAAAQMVAAVHTIEAIQVARLGDLAAARRILDTARAEAEASRARDEAVDRQVAEMAQLRHSLPAVAGAGAAEESEADYDDRYDVETESAPAPSPSDVRAVHNSAMDIMGY